jgi:hypothetical protein
MPPLPKELKLSQEVARAANLTKIDLLSLHVERNINSSIRVEDAEIRQSLGVERFAGEDPEHFGVIVKCVVEASEAPEGGENNSKAEEGHPSSSNYFMSIEISYLAVYRLRTGTKNFSDEQLDCFSSLNVPINVWPYIREAIQNVTSRMGYPPLTLDFLKMVDLVKALKAVKAAGPDSFAVDKR